MASHTPGFAAVRLGTADAPLARYTSGLTIHEEALVGGRWIGRYWQATGYVESEYQLR